MGLEKIEATEPAGNWKEIDKHTCNKGYSEEDAQDKPFENQQSERSLSTGHIDEQKEKSYEYEISSQDEDNSQGGDDSEAEFGKDPTTSINSVSEPIPGW